MLITIYNNAGYLASWRENYIKTHLALECAGAAAACVYKIKIHLPGLIHIRKIAGTATISQGYLLDV